MRTSSSVFPQSLARPVDAGQFIMHGGQMQLIQRVIAADEERIVVAFDVPLDSAFHDPGGVPAWVGIEYMAQAIAVWSGYHAKARNPSSEPQIGLLLGTRKYTAHVDQFPSGETFHVYAERKFMSEDGLGQFHCEILDQVTGEVLAEASISVFEPDDAATLLRGVTHAH